MAFTKDWRGPRRNQPLQVSTLDIDIMLPFDRQQQTEFTCGPECLAQVLRYHGVNVPVEQLELECGCNDEEGTDWEGMVAAARVHGMKADLVKLKSTHGLHIEMKHRLRRRHTIIICIDAWGSKHFVVPVGWLTHKPDAANNHDGVVLFYDPYIIAGRLGRVSMEKLIKRIDDHTVLVIDNDPKYYFADWIER